MRVKSEIMSMGCNKVAAKSVKAHPGKVPLEKFPWKSSPGKVPLGNVRRGTFDENQSKKCEIFLMRVKNQENDPTRPVPCKQGGRNTTTAIATATAAATTTTATATAATTTSTTKLL